MKHIVIGFEDFFGGFAPKNNIIYRLLSEHYEVEVADVTKAEERKRVQYLFFSASGNNYLNYSCVRIFVTGENLCPNFNLCDYAMGFEYMDFEDRYFRLPIYLWDMYSEDYDLISGKKERPYGASPEKRKFCGMVVSNNLFADPKREQVFRKISEYKNVDSGGRAFNNIGLPDGVPDKRGFLSEYKFSIASENSSYSGYCTEKLMQAFSAGTVPVYWGDPRAAEVFNKKAFIDCTGLSFDEMIEAVRAVDTDDARYLSMLNEPILVDPQLKEKTEKELAKWLSNIMDQEYEKAKRVPLCGKMAVYEQNYHKKVIMEKKIKQHKVLYKMAKGLAGLKKK